MHTNRWRGDGCVVPASRKKQKLVAELEVLFSGIAAVKNNPRTYYNAEALWMKWK